MSFSAGDHFTVTGTLGDRTVTITYERGELSGDDEAVRQVTGVLEQHSSLRLTPQGDAYPAELDQPHAVMAAIQHVIAIDEVEGDYPIPEADDSAT